jgi:hypothetical protein
MIWISGTRQRSAIVAAFAFACSPSLQTLSTTPPYGCLLPQDLGFSAAAPHTPVQFISCAPILHTGPSARRPLPDLNGFDSVSVHPRRRSRLDNQSLGKMSFHLVRHAWRTNFLCWLLRETPPPGFSLLDLWSPSNSRKLWISSWKRHLRKARLSKLAGVKQRFLKTSQVILIIDLLQKTWKWTRTFAKDCTWPDSND